ncbi:MAG: hypothetical protein IJ911_12390 [Salinivirgaceae bacterium]|nr:hypothetical protein [Salinivirgaceae bacterium]
MNRRILFSVLLVISGLVVHGQESHSLYMDQEFNHFDRYVYQKQNRFHTSVKPYQMRQVNATVNADSLYRMDVSRKLPDILLNRSWLGYKQDDFEFTIDPLMHFEFGRDSDYDKMSWTNTRGIMVNARLGKYVFVTSDFYENQAKFYDYRRQVVKNTKAMPGQGSYKAFKEDGYDYAWVDATVSFQPDEHFDITFGHGKNFIGDGYRSMILSDASFNYPFLRITTDFWHIKYVNLWAQFQDLEKHYDYGHPHDKKWGSFNYLDWSVTPWLNVGFFESVIWANADSLGHRGFDINYANPVIFTRPVEFSVGSPDNALMGLTGKLTLWSNHVLYGQFIIDEFKLENVKAGIKHQFNKSDSTIQWGWWANKWALQMGYKTYDLFGLEHLDIQAEMNVARPFMYSHVTHIQNYGHYRQPLAHPLGSNFKEFVLIGRYNYKRLFVEAKYIHAMHGRDVNGMNMGNNIFLDYTTHGDEYHNEIGQGEKVILQNTNLKAAFLINPRTNMNVYLGLNLRSEETSGEKNKNKLITFGLRTSLQNIYYDF